MRRAGCEDPLTPALSPEGEGENAAALSFRAEGNNGTALFHLGEEENALSYGADGKKAETGSLRREGESSSSRRYTILASLLPSGRRTG